MNILNLFKSKPKPRFKLLYKPDNNFKFIIQELAKDYYYFVNSYETEEEALAAIEMLKQFPKYF